MGKLDKVNAFLTNLETPKIQEDNTVILSGPDAIRNILLNETVKLNKLEMVSNELLQYLTDSRVIRELSYKDKKSLFETISQVQNNSRDFIFRFAELSNKNTFLQEILKLANTPKEIITSENGETYVSTVDDDTRKHLSEILRDIVNDRVSK